MCCAIVVCSLSQELDVVGILGNPSPAGSRVCHNTTLRSSGARELEVSRCYRHIAPLERKAAQFGVRHLSQGLGFLAKYPNVLRYSCMFIEPGVLHDVVGILGNPPPTGSTVCHNTTLRSSGARGLDVSRCYRHVAPLERKASQINALHRRVRSPCAGGWVTHLLRVQPCATIRHCAPLERGDWTCRAAIDMSLLWSERQAKSMPFIVG